MLFQKSKHINSTVCFIFYYQVPESPKDYQLRSSSRIERADPDHARHRQRPFRRPRQEKDRKHGLRQQREQQQRNNNNNNKDEKDHQHLLNGDSIPYIDQEGDEAGMANTITPAPSPSSTAGERTTLDVSGLSSSSPNGAVSTTSASPPAATSTPFSSPGDQRPPARFDRRPRVLLSLKYSLNLSALSVVVHKAKNLQETPHTTVRPSPYVKLYAIESITPGGASRRVGDSKRKTKSQKGRVNPIFEETLTYYMPPQQLKRKRLELSVCSDRGLLGRNVVLGRCIVGLSGVHKALGKDSNTATVTDWFHLSPTERDLHGSSSNIRKSNTFGGSDRLPRKAAQPPKQSASATSLR